jgi:EAL domain-containing protein (putative c-di-GMP-specific phosphodiesterase class I)
MVSAADFIPLAEETGLIVPLGRWILRQACADAAALPETIRLAVNLSTVQLCGEDLSDFVLHVLSETGLAPERLELEITEPPNPDDRQALLATMRRLKDIGVNMVLDDFGSGHSSINFLTSFPFDRIKIDRPFSQGAIDRSEHASLVTSTLTLAQRLGILTTAEGVETEQQLEYLRDAGVDMVQGYLVGRPVPIGDFAAQAALMLDRLCRSAQPQKIPTRRQRGNSKMPV